MSDIKIENSNHVVYVLQYEDQEQYDLKREPEGWDEDDLEIVRNEDYHGITTQFTNGLKFRGGAKEYILEAYRRGGLNTNLYLIKYVLKSNAKYKVTPVDLVGSSAPAFEERYRGLADFTTLSQEENYVEINFNSDELERLIKTHENDDFEIERTTDLDGDEISDFSTQQTVVIDGRDLEAKGEAYNLYDVKEEFQNFDIAYNKFTVPTKFEVKGADRHVEVTNGLFDQTSSLLWQANFFYNDSQNRDLITRVEIDLEADLKAWIYQDIVNNAYIDLQVGIYKFTGFGYEQVDTIPLKRWYNDQYDTYETQLVIDMGIPYNWAFTLEFEVTNIVTPQNGYFQYRLYINKWNMKIREISRYDNSFKTHNFLFVNEVGTRLMEIITGKKQKFYSKLFGRNYSDWPPPSTGVPNAYEKQSGYSYFQDGRQGNVGLIHGFSIRRFSKFNPLYKPMTISLRKYLMSLKATFNVGIGVEKVGQFERLRVEELRYFYQDRVGVKLPNQVVDVKRTVNDSMFVSAVTVGSNKGGNYEEGLGLDEPNVQSTFITPLRKTENKYELLSDIRSDDYGLEIIRRKPEFLDETEDTSQDDHIWYLDLKQNPDYTYSQLSWDDADPLGLQSLPTGIFNPETYKSWKFTPKRSLLRHGWNIRAGMEHAVYMNKILTLSSSKSNVNLVSQAYDENLPVSESDDVIISDLDRSPVLPELVSFKHPVSDELFDLIMGTTPIEIGGEVEQVRNWYLKFQWVNEEGKTETGYLKSFKPQSDEFEFYKANENVIY